MAMNTHPWLAPLPLFVRCPASLAIPRWPLHGRWCRMLFRSHRSLLDWWDVREEENRSARHHHHEHWRYSTNHRLQRHANDCWSYRGRDRQRTEHGHGSSLAGRDFASKLEREAGGDRINSKHCWILALQLVAFPVFTAWIGGLTSKRLIHILGWLMASLLSTALWLGMSLGLLTSLSDV